MLTTCSLSESGMVGRRSGNSPKRILAHFCGSWWPWLERWASRATTDGRDPERAARRAHCQAKAAECDAGAAAPEAQARGVRILQIEVSNKDLEGLRGPWCVDG